MESLKSKILYLFGKVIFSILSIFPLKKCVVFSNFNGKRYDDNPRYISEKLYEKDPSIKQIWLIHKGYSFVAPKYVEMCQWPSIKMFYYLATSAVWVDSHSKPLYVNKRNNQLFIETWHGGLGFKKIEYDASDALPQYYLDTSLHSTNMADVFISNSSWLSEIYRRAFKYNGLILEFGYPKNDIFFNPYNKNIRYDVFSKLNIPFDKKIVLYAPTFRDEYSFSDWFTLDFNKILNCLNSKKNDFIILVKMHPKYINKFSLKKLGIDNKDIIDVTNYTDTQKLLISTDLFITDYSSTIFDFSLTKRAAFIYASDYEIYKRKSRDLYFDLKLLPFPFANNTDELINNIKKFNYKKYLNNLNTFFDEVGLKENGNSSEKCADYIITKLNHS